MATPPEAGASVQEWTAYAMAMQEALKEAKDAERQATKEKEALVGVLTMQSSMKPPVATTHHRKPELPPFSTKDIENWIRRVKNAYQRVGISDAKSKFAFLENIIGSETTPTINSFMVHPNPTDATWDAFLEHLTQRYGRTTQQQAQSVLRNFKRHGRTPEDMWAHMLEQVGDLTLQDVLKENLYQELPPAVRQHLSGELPNMTPAALAKAANRFFDRDGNLENAGGNSVNQVRQSQASSALPSSNDVSEFEPIHHVGGRPQSRPQGGRSKSRGRWNQSQKRFPQDSSNAPNPMTAGDMRLNAKGLCFVHDKFGDDAFVGKCRNVKCVRHGTGRQPDKGRGRGQGNAKGGGR